MIAYMFTEKVLEATSLAVLIISVSANLLSVIWHWSYRLEVAIVAN